MALDDGGYVGGGGDDDGFFGFLFDDFDFDFGSIFDSIGDIFTGSDVSFGDDMGEDGAGAGSAGSGSYGAGDEDNYDDTGSSGGGVMDFLNKNQKGLLQAGMGFLSSYQQGRAADKAADQRRQDQQAAAQQSRELTQLQLDARKAEAEAERAAAAAKSKEEHERWKEGRTLTGMDLPILRREDFNKGLLGRALNG